MMKHAAQAEVTPFFCSNALTRLSRVCRCSSVRYSGETSSTSGRRVRWVGIGAVSMLLGVAGGELIIPTLVLAFRRADQSGRDHEPSHQHSDDARRARPASGARRVSGRARGRPHRATDGGGDRGGKCRRRAARRLRAGRGSQAALGLRADRVGTARLQGAEPGPAFEPETVPDSGWYLASNPESQSWGLALGV